MAKEPNPPTLTAADRAAIDEILARGKTLPCGGRTWEGPKNAGTPIYRMVDPTAVPNQVSARRLVQALKTEESTGVIEWPKRNLYAEHWGCIDHVVTDRTKAAKEPPVPAGYVQVRDPLHPLATRGGLVLEHRAVLHDRLGDGPQRCHWCPRPLRWDAAPFQPDELTVDHLDRDRANNDPANLVPACRPCNSSRRGPQAATWRPHSEPHEPHSAVVDVEPVRVPEQDREPREVREAREAQGKDKTRRIGPFEALEQGLSWLQGNRRATVVLVLLGLFLAGLFGTAFMLTSPASFLPGVRTDPHDGPEPTWPGGTVPTLPGETPTTAELQPPTTRPASTTTALATTTWTMCPPCTPTSCPCLDNSRSRS